MGFGRVLGDFSDRARSLMNSLGGASSSSAIGGTPSFGFGQHTALARVDSGAVEHMIEQRHAPDNPFTATLAQIEVNPKVSKTDNIEVKLRLPKPPAQMSKADYDKAYLKELFHRAGYSNITDTDLAAFQSAVIKYTGEPFGLAADVSTLREIHGRTGHIESTTSEWRQAVVDAGAREIYRQRDEWTTAVDAAQAKSREYGTDALKGWAALHVNAPVNLINGLTEPLRGLAAAGGAYIPPVPRWEAIEKSEYWQVGNKGQAAELAGTVTAGALAGGASVLATTPGKVIATLEATYNIGVGAAGVDPTQHNRAMSPLERTARVMGGVVMAAGVSQNLGGAKSAGATAASATQEAEMVLSDGSKVRVRVPTEESQISGARMQSTPIDKSKVDGTYSELSTDAGLAANEAKGGHLLFKHVGQSDAEMLQRLASEPRTPAVSTWTDRTTAEKVVADTLTANQGKIQQWIASPNGTPTLRLRYTRSPSNPLGRGIIRGNNVSQPMFDARIVLKRDGAGDWFVLTGFPEP